MCEVIELPECINPATWQQYDDYRKHISGTKWTELAKLLSIKKLIRYSVDGHDANEIIETTIANGWTGLFAPKHGKKPVLDNFSLKQYGKSGKI